MDGNDDMCSFTFQHVFNRQVPVDSLDMRASYHFSMEPLVRDVTMGESALVVLGGAPSLEASRYLSSCDGQPGLFISAAAQLLEASAKRAGGSVTLTWCKVDCTDPAEPLTDVLKNASTGASGTIFSSTHSSNETLPTD